MSSLGPPLFSTAGERADPLVFAAGYPLVAGIEMSCAVSEENGGERKGEAGLSEYSRFRGELRPPRGY